MLNIEIVNGNPDGSLELRENGNPSSGDSGAQRNWPVHWRVRPHSNVQHIIAIAMKTGPGAPASTDIFSNDPPCPQGSTNSGHWKGRVNSSAPINAEFHYEIHWRHRDGTNKIYDPKIAVLPSKRRSVEFLAPLIAGLLALFTLGLFRSRRSRN